MTLLAVRAFSGQRPIVDARLLDNGDAQLARNARLISGSIAPLRGTTTLKALTLPNPATIFRYGSSATETNYWLEFSQDTDVMRSPIANDQYDRLYWTNGNNKPRYAPNSLILSGNGTYPGASYELGLPAPSTAISVTSFTPVVNATVVAREYVLTLYNPTTLKESLPGAVFSVQGVDGSPVKFLNITTDNRGDAGITKKRLYRRVSGTFRRVVELDLVTTSYEDSATDASLTGAATITSTASPVPTPTKAPTLSAPAAVSASSSTREYVYTVTNYTASGVSYKESQPSLVRTVSADATQTVTLGGFSNSLSGTKFRIYRRDQGATQYLFVAEIPTSQTTFQDPIGTTKLGNPLEYDGAQQAAGTPTASVSASTVAAVVKRIYMVTWVDASGNESGKGPSSAVVDVVDGVTEVSLTHSDTFAAGISKKRLYRQTVTVSNAGIVTNDANWKLVTEVSASVTSFADKATEASLTTLLASNLRDLPSQPTALLTGNATIPPKVVPETRTYVYTYVSAYGEEGPPSAASASVDVDPDKSVTISLGAAPVGNYNVTTKRIYRSSTVGSRASFQFVAEIAVATTSYVDNVSQDNLGEVLPSETWIAPPAGLKGLRLMANGAAVGFVGRTLYLSEPNLPHAWPNQYTVDDDIVGIATFGQSVAVLTKSFPFVFTGVDPAAMSSTKLKLPQACVSKRSIVETGDGVVYASPDGLVQIGTNIGVVTQNLLSRDQWQQLNPSSIDAYLHNGRVIMFWATNNTRGTVIFDLSGQGAVLTVSDFNTTTAVTAGFYDAKSDLLYFAQGGSIVRFDQGSSLTFLWKSKVFRLSNQQNLSFGQVRAEAYPVTFRMYGDGVLRHTQTVANDLPFRLPSGFRALNYEFEVEGSNTVTEVFLSSSAVELKAA